MRSCGSRNEVVHIPKSPDMNWNTDSGTVLLRFWCLCVSRDFPVRNVVVPCEGQALNGGLKMSNSNGLGAGSGGGFMTGMGSTVEDGGYCTVFECLNCRNRKFISNQKLEFFWDNYPVSIINSPLLDALCPKCHRVGTLAADHRAPSPLRGDQLRELQDRQDGTWPMGCNSEGCETRRYVVVFGEANSTEEKLRRSLAAAVIPAEFCCSEGHPIVGIAAPRQKPTASLPSFDPSYGAV